MNNGSGGGGGGKKGKDSRSRLHQRIMESRKQERVNYEKKLQVKGVVVVVVVAVGAVVG